jgi:hypothetical protein
MVRDAGQSALQPLHGESQIIANEHALGGYQLMMQFAAFLVVALGLAHSILGERYILMRLFRREDLPKIFGSAKFTAQTLRFAWHITTVAWFGFAALLVQIDQGQLTSSSAAKIIGFTSIASAFLPLIITRGKHLSWLVLFIIGGISLFWGAA